MNGAPTIPFSISFIQKTGDLGAGLDLGPFLSMPTDFNPKTDGLLEHNTFSWKQSGTVPDLDTLNVVRLVFPKCWDFDLSGNPGPMQSPFPQQETLFSGYATGGPQSMPLPRLPPGVGMPPSVSDRDVDAYYWILQTALEPRFNFGEFVYNQLFATYWRSWTFSYDRFFSREESP